MAPTDPRRFSYGDSLSDLVDVAAWKFDVQLGDVEKKQVTAYAIFASRGDALRALFEEYPAAKIFGTGLPLTVEAAEAEIGRLMIDGEVRIVPDFVDSA